MQEILQFIATIGIWILIFWVPFQVNRLNQTIKAQSELIQNFESQSGYLSNVQQTMSRLYDPAEIESIIEAKVMSARNELAKEHKDNLKNTLETTINMYSKDVSTLVTFGVISASYLSDEDFKFAKKSFINAGGKENWAEIFQENYEKIQSSKRKALANALRGIPLGAET